MSLINLSLNAIDTIFSTRSQSSWEPKCPPGTYISGYTMDEWSRWRIVCLTPLYVEDVEDIFIFVTLITGFLLMGLGGALWYRRWAKAALDPTELIDKIETVVFAVATQSVLMGRKFENIAEKLAAMQRVSPGEQDNETL